MAAGRAFSKTKILRHTRLKSPKSSPLRLQAGWSTVAWSPATRRSRQTRQLSTRASALDPSAATDLTPRSGRDDGVDLGSGAFGRLSDLPPAIALDEVKIEVRNSRAANLFSVELWTWRDGRSSSN